MAVPAPLNFPALHGDPVTEAHARDCRDNGHAAHVVDGRPTGVCPRCGEVTERPRVSLVKARPYAILPVDMRVEFRPMDSDTGDTGEWMEGYVYGYSATGTVWVADGPTSGYGYSCLTPALPTAVRPYR